MSLGTRIGKQTSRTSNMLRAKRVTILCAPTSMAPVRSDTSLVGFMNGNVRVCCARTVDRWSVVVFLSLGGDLLGVVQEPVGFKTGAFEDETVGDAPTWLTKG